MIFILPSSYQEKLEKNENFDLPLSENQSSQFLHGWFAKDIDKYSVTGLSVIFPIAALWANFFVSICLKNSCMVSLTISGQAIIVINYALGFWMIRRANKKLNEAFKYIMENLTKRETELATQNPPPQTSVNSADDDLPF